MSGLNDLPNIRHMAGIVAVADRKTVSAAADWLNMSQPALTQGIARTEALVGVDLFRRGSGGLFATDPGQVFIARLRRGFRFLGTAGRIAGREGFDRRVTLGQLHGLIAVVDAGGFRAAAAQLDLVPSSVSRACRDLEAECAVPLFETTSAGLRPTHQAEEIARFARLALNEFRQALHEARGWRGDYAGRLAIGCLPLVQASIVPEALNRFAPEFPAVAPQVVDGYYAALARALRRGELDLLIGALRADDLPDGLVQSRLFSDPLLVAADPHHPLAGRRGVTLAELAAFPWIAPRLGAPARTYFGRMHAALTVPPQVPRPIETGSHSVMRGLLIGSDRLVLISKTQVARDIALGLLAQIDVPVPDSARDIGVTHIEGWLPSLPQARFLEILRRVTAEAAV